MPSLQCDALRLPFADGSMPFVYSVSALEHIAERGDTEAMQEIARVLVPGGVAVITVPLVCKSYERWIETDPYGGQAHDAAGRVFFSRYYDWKSLPERLLAQSGLLIVTISAWQETKPGWYDRYCTTTARPYSVRSIATKAFDVLWATRRIGWVEGGPAQLQRHGIAAIVVQKRSGVTNV
jgi:SAM-dependent methyltransferase